MNLFCKCSGLCVSRQELAVAVREQHNATFRLNQKIETLQNIMAKTKIDVDAALGTLKTQLDAAATRTVAAIQKIQDALDALIKNPPAAEDLADEVASINALAEEAKTIAQPTPPVTPGA